MVRAFPSLDAIKSRSSGPNTFKKKMVPIEQAEGMAGCCYNPSTHACPCFTTEQEIHPK